MAIGYAETLDHNARMRRQPKAELAEIVLKKAENGGIVAHHRMTDGKEPMHQFGPDDGHEFAEHLEKHLGISMHDVSPEKEEHINADADDKPGKSEA